jgi:REP-associated tyrosine transposase
MDSSSTVHRRNFNDPLHAHELTFSCYRRYPFLKAERTCEWLGAAIDDARKKLKFSLWAYVFMPEHVHLLVHSCFATSDIARIRQAIKEPVARTAIKYLEAHAPEWLSRITRRRGDRSRRLFWQLDGGYDRNITEPETLASVVDYIHLNPVRRGLIDRADRWRWSSAAWFARSGASPLVPDQIPSEWRAS